MSDSRNSDVTYTASFSLLKSLYVQHSDRIDIPGSPVRILNHSFVSGGRSILPGSSGYRCPLHGIDFDEEPPAGPGDHHTPVVDVLTMGDVAFSANSEFRYSIFAPAAPAPSGRVILLLHGLNERSWAKYLPWALRLVEETGSAVILFPIAFHMNRSPVEWSLPKPMRSVAERRQLLHPSIAGSSFANAAISSRLHANPRRFFWTGLQTYTDVLQLVRQIRSGAVGAVRPDARVDVFAYSIGAFLAEILMMADEEGWFSDSRLFIFCGGPTFDRMYPVSKYILDSEALIAIYAFYVEHLENEFKHDARLAHYFQEHASGRYFQAMLSNRKSRELRERRFLELSSRVAAVALRNDSVIQPSEVLNTLRGNGREIPIAVHIKDFGFSYSHVNPFPVTATASAAVDAAFDEVFDLAAGHLG